MNKITVIGMGIMGKGVAKTFASLGNDVVVWNRTSQKAEQIVSEYKTEQLNINSKQNSGSFNFASQISDAVRHGDYIFLTLYDYNSTKTVLDQIVPYIKPEAIIIQCATIGVDSIKKLGETAHKNNLNLLEANMMGSKTQAESGQLSWIVGGDKSIYEKCETLLKSNSAGVVYCGPNLGDGSLVKLSCNIWISLLTAGTAQSIKLLQNSDINPQLFLDVIKTVPANSPYAHLKGEKMINNDNSKQFALNALLKDLDLAKSALKDVGENQKLLDLVIDLYKNSSNSGHGDDDISAVISEF